MAHTLPIEEQQARRADRGIALVTVVLILLVLTALGIAAVMMMTQEDRTASRQDVLKAALYAAEAGLRRGEAVLSNSLSDNPTLTGYLSHAASASTPAAPNPVPTPPAPCAGTSQLCGTVGGTPLYFIPPQCWDVNHLGTYLTATPGGADELANQEVAVADASGSGQRMRAFYSVYIRNNPDDTDPTTGCVSPLTNFDRKVRLVAVGFITDSGGVVDGGRTNVVAVKILEEEFNFLGTGAGGMTLQKLNNAQGTSSGMFDGA